MKRLFASGLLLLLLQVANAQTMSADNIKNIKVSQLNTIKEGSDVKGYYLYFISDKIDKKTSEYTLRIMDDNLKILKDIKFQQGNNVSILESSFNGSDLMFLFYNADDKSFEYQVFGADGKKKPFSYTREISKKEVAYLRQVYHFDDEEGNYKGINPIEGKGFVSLMPSREDKDYTFQLDFFASDKRKQWSYIPTEGSKKVIGDYLGTFNGVVYVEELKFKTLFDNSPDSYIVGIDIETGKKIFEKLTDAKFRILPCTLAILNDGKAYIYGEFYESNANVWKDKSKGFAFLGIDEKGKIVSEKYLAWDMEMSKYMSVSSKGKIDDFGYLYLHKIIQTADGNIYAVGEGFKKTANALGIASAVLSRGASANNLTKLNITDLLLIKFDKNFSVKEAKFIQKNPNQISIEGADYMSAPLTAKMISSLGGFDYEYTQVNKDMTSFSVCYSDYEKSKDYKGGTFNSISYNEGKITTDKIKTKSDASVAWVLPGKQGQVLVVEYFKKAKRLDAHFEKLN